MDNIFLYFSRVYVCTVKWGGLTVPLLIVLQHGSPGFESGSSSDNGKLCQFLGGGIATLNHTEQ